MSLIAITYGYNQFSIFNINVSTQPLIDSIKAVCLDEIVANLQARAVTLQKEIDTTSFDEENLKKILKKLDQDKINEEKAAEALIKANDEANALKAKDTKIKKAVQPIKKGQMIGSLTDNKVLLQITEDIRVNQAGLGTASANKEKFIDKKKKLMRILEEFKELVNNKITMKIDLVDIHGEKVNISSKGDAYACEYLQSRQCYELNRVTESNS